MLVVPFVIINFGINLNLQMPNIFQQSEKLYSRLFAGLTMAGYADALRPEKLSGEHFKRWRVKVTLWLTAKMCSGLVMARQKVNFLI